MTQPAYPAAREAAARVHPGLARHHEPNAAILPDGEIIEAIIDCAFWASLRREEIYTPRISLAFVAREQVDQPLVLERPVPLMPQPLTRIGPAVERPGIHLGVSMTDEGLRVWGATLTLPVGCFVLEVLAPGLLVVKQSRRGESGKFMNIAVLQGEQIKVVNPHAAIAPDFPTLITSLLGLDSQFTPAGSANVLMQLAVSMRAHGRGGALLVVPAGPGQSWRESILQPITYSVDPPFSALADLMRADHDKQMPLARAVLQEGVQDAVEGVAGLTAVDGATIVTDQYDLLAFGAKIVRRSGSQHVGHVMVTEPIEGAVARTEEPAQLGGTRHLSAAQFAHDQRDSIALVASQDGRFTVFAWSPCQEMVHAHRIETLLL